MAQGGHGGASGGLVISRVALALTLALAGCASLLEPYKPWVPIDPPRPIYSTWWAETESCSKLSGVETEVVKGYFLIGEHDDVAGAFWRRRQYVFLVLGWDYHEMVVRHEQLHALLWTQGITGHPEEYFKRRCRLTWDTWTSYGSAAEKSYLRYLFEKEPPNK